MRLVTLLAAWTLLLAAPSGRAAARSVLIEGVPHVQQKPDFCGEACAEMVLRKLGRKVTQDQVFEQSGLDPAMGRGCYTAELNTALQRLGFRVGGVWARVETARAAEQMEAQWQALYEDLVQGTPSIVCMHYDERPDTTEHFRLVLGFDPAADAVLYHEPAAAAGAYRRMKRAQFLKLWPLQYDSQYSTVIRFRMAAGQVPELRPASGFSRADFAQHVMRLRPRLPAGFTVVVQSPFVVLGDEDAATVRQRARDTVRWAADRLKQEYFKKDPREILDVWLFRDRESYEKHTRQLFRDTPDTPYGYYSPAHGALIMNIATGGGTLVHEIVHPFMEANFPACPPWFNEGMGSLYEQCGDRNGHISGHTNWRLSGLQKAIQAGSVPSFEKLLAMDTEAFYQRDRGTNYGQARYLCYYLQEKGLLSRYYREFLAGHKEDPTGVRTLKAVLGETDLAAFKKRWEAFVLGLRFP